MHYYLATAFRPCVLQNKTKTKEKKTTDIILTLWLPSAPVCLVVDSCLFSPNKKHLNVPYSVHCILLLCCHQRLGVRERKGGVGRDRVWERLWERVCACGSEIVWEWAWMRGGVWGIDRKRVYKCTIHLPLYSPSVESPEAKRGGCGIVWEWVWELQRLYV